MGVTGNVPYLLFFYFFRHNIDLQFMDSSQENLNILVRRFLQRSYRELGRFSAMPSFPEPRTWSETGSTTSRPTGIRCLTALSRAWCNYSAACDPSFLQTMLCWHGAGGLAGVTERMCSHPFSRRGHVAGPARGKGAQPRYALRSLNRLSDHNPRYGCQQLAPYLFLRFCAPLVDQDLGFQDKYLFYRFLDDEEEDTPLPSEEEKRESEEELPETILFLAQIGPDALLRMILRKSSVTVNDNISCFPNYREVYLCICWPSNRNIR